MIQGKIALEEHCLPSAFPDPGFNPAATANDPDYFTDVRRRLVETDQRLREMDRCGIERMVLSLANPGIQGIADARQATDVARRVNDELAERFIAPHPERFAGFAAVALQDPRAAAQELERAVRQLGFKGALINGYSELGDGEQVQYLDEAPAWTFWECVAALDVPVYLHPREPLRSQQRLYEGYPALVGAAWGFGVETAGHSLRLMLSGLFDRFPNLTVILGHLGEGLPFLVSRVEHRLRHVKPEARGAQQLPLTTYFQRNFYVTTSGAFRTSALLQTLLEVGSDRVLFSVDYPYETIQEQADWFDAVPLSDLDKTKIGGDNARRLLRLSTP